MRSLLLFCWMSLSLMAGWNGEMTLAILFMLLVETNIIMGRLDKLDKLKDGIDRTEAGIACLVKYSTAVAKRDLADEPLENSNEGR